MPRRHSLLLLSFAALWGGCATAGPLGPATVARLEHTRAEHPRSAPAHRALGIAYYKLNRYGEARQTLEQAAAIDSTDGTTQLFLGMTAEAQNDLPAARQAYSSYVSHGHTSRVRHLLEQRLAALNRKELTLAARREIANEATLSSIPGPPTTVAVLPLSFSGRDSTLRPLGRGLAELLTTDLAQSPALTVVERTRVQALLTEIELQQSGATDRATRVRAGRILQAGRLVAGGITQTGADIRVDAPIVNVTDARVVGTPSDTRTLDQVFTIEKNIAFGILSSLGVTLTTAQRDAIEQRPTKSLAAFLAYSRGLTFQDEGRFDAAAQSFRQAVQIDPGFGAAARQEQQTSTAAAGERVTPASMETALSGTAEGRVMQSATRGALSTDGGRGAASTVQMVAGGLNPTVAGVATLGGGVTSTTRTTERSNPGATATGGDNVASAMTAIVTILVLIPR
jgi:TolB-like protein